MFFVASVGYAFFEYIETSEKINTNKTLASVGQLKSGQIQAYLAERKGDAAVVSSFLNAPLAQHWLTRQYVNAPDTLNQLAESVITAFQYRELLLLDASANTRLGVGHGGMLSQAGKAIALRAMRERTPVSFQIYFGDPSAPDVPVLDTFVPVMNADGSRAVGMVVLRNELNILFSLLQTWPVESATAESLLVTKDGSDVLFLNELRHKKGTALKLRVPLSSDTNSPAWPAISAVTGRFGLFEANDYRGMHILAYTLAVPDTPWGMVVKMDVAEATERSRTLQKITAMVIMAIVALVGIISWIGWRKVKAEQLAKKSLVESQHRLVQSERMLNEAQQLAHLGSWERDLATGSLTCSEEIFSIFEIDPAHTDISYEEFMLAVHPEDREMVDQAYLTCIWTREPFDIVHRLLFADGRVKWVNEHGTFFYNANGVPLRSIGAIQDITERKRADDMLRVAATTFETHEGIVITDAHANIIRINQAFQDITGYSQEEVLGKSTRILHSGRQDKAFYAAMWQQLLNNGSWTGELWNKRKDGLIYPEWLTISSVKNKQGETTEYVGIFTDITERKLMEENMQRSEKKFRTLYEASGDAIMLLDKEKGFFDCNEATLRVFGCTTRDDFINKHPSRFSPPTQPSGQDSMSLANEHIATAFKNGSNRFEWMHRRLDGTEFPAEVWLMSMELDGRQILHATVRDITERKQLEGTRARFVAIMEETSDIVAMADLTGHLIYMNRAGRKLLELDEAADISKTEIADYHPKWAAEIVLREGLQTAAACGTWSGETALLSRSGREFAVLQVIMAHRRQGDGVEYYSTVIHDISNRKEVENELCAYVEELRTINQQLHDTQNLLLQSDKMASVGQLAAGVAHEINNPIGYVASNLGTLDGYLKELFGLVATYEEMESAVAVADNAALARIKAVKNKVDLDFLKEDVLSLMRESQEGIIRVKKIVQDLKDFSRVDSGDEWHRADLHKGLDSTLNVASNEIKYKANVKKEYGDIAEVECVISQLNQVFMNLLVNAAHAIEERGTITLRTGQQGDEVWVEVADTGKGIAPEHINKIFDPFFTTKPVGKGTGLGLSLSYGIIQKHHGRIEVNSEEGKGTSFKVWLPVNQPQDGDTAVGQVSAA
ncbi:MAG: PAS domain S-box protein [Gallionella sp.]|nr:PAS domain S-box protein [Gallionella sp.]